MSPGYNSYCLRGDGVLTMATGTRKGEDLFEVNSQSYL